MPIRDRTVRILFIWLQWVLGKQSDIIMFFPFRTQPIFERLTTGYPAQNYSSKTVTTFRLQVFCFAFN